MRVRKRRRSEGAHQGEPQVLSSPMSDALAPQVVSELGDQKRTLDGHLQAGVVNAFWQKTDLTLVLRDDTMSNGVRFRRLKAEHSCFIKRSDMDDPVQALRNFNRESAVRKAVWEPDNEWLRVVWQDRQAAKHWCAVLQSDEIVLRNRKREPKTPIPTYEGLVSPVLRYMVDNDVKPVHPRRVWVDLEMDSRVPFSRKEEMRILCWVTVDAAGNIRKGLLEHDTDADEKRVLQELWDVLEQYDQVIAWNGDRFDFVVIKARSELHDLLRPAVRDWRRWLWLDQWLIFQRMNMAAAESGDEKQSLKLGDVAMSLLGVGKHDFDASKTWEAWEAGGVRRQELLDYCVQDTVLMPQIEEKTGYIMLLQTVADTCGTFADVRGSNPGVQVEGFLARLALDQGHKFPTVLKRRKGETYEGAYVLHPEKEAGIYRDVHVADFASLYPTIIVTWNMSPDTITEAGQRMLSHSPLTGCHFETHRQGLLPLAVTQLMQLRKEWSDRKAAAIPGTAEAKDADRRSAAYKITANSFYGVIGAPHSRHYDPKVAESVAQCGKWLILETIKAAEARGMQVIYGDTDSLFVEGATRTEFELFCKWCNAELYPRILADVGCPEEWQSIKLAYEKQFDRFIITTAKKYVGSYVHYKGTDADATSKPEIKGLEFKRGDFIRLARRLQEEIVYRLVGYQSSADPDDPDGFDDVVQGWMDRVLEGRFGVEDVIISKRLGKDLADYTTDLPHTRIAKEMEARGEDVGEGARINYVIIDAIASPQKVMAVDEWDPNGDDMDRLALWDKLVWPPTERLVKTAFPKHDWRRFAGLVRARKALARHRAKVVRDAEKDQEKAAKALQRAQAKHIKLAAKGAPPMRRRRVNV